MPKQVSSVYHFGLRWTIPHTAENQLKLIRYLRHHAQIDKFIFQAEFTVHEGKDNPHYQGYFHSKKKDRPKKWAISMNREFRGIEIQASSTDGIDALSNYCMKEDRVAGPWADKKIYMGSDLWSDDRIPDWQKSLNEILDQPPGDRKMIWVYDKKGYNGKTKYVKTVVFRKNGVGLGYGSSNDVLNLVSKFPGKNVYIWNLTRAKPQNLSELDLYAAMESVKDGYFINLKFETAMVLMDCPHVVVMANHLPKKHHISLDRWCQYEIKDGKLLPYIEVGPIVPNAL